MEVDEDLEIGDRVVRRGEPELAGRLGPAELAADLVTGLLVERAEVVVERRARGEGHDRADVLALQVEGPALVDLARAERGGQGVRGRIAAAEPAQVDDVPRRRVAGVDLGAGAGEVAGDGVGDRRKPLRVAEDRRVVRVVGRPEEDGLRGGRHGRQGDRVAVADLRRGARVVRLDLVAMHERDDRDGLVDAARSQTISV